MKITGTLLVASLLALAILAPSAYPQRQPSEKEMLNDLTLDVINLTSQVKELKTSMDQRGTNLTKLVEGVIDRFSALDVTLQRLNDSIGGIRSDNEKNSRELQDVKILVETLKGNVRDVGEGLNGLNRQLGTVSDKVTTMTRKEEVLPSANALWLQAYSDYSAGNYAIAISEFRELLAQFPNDERAAGSQLYIGLSYSLLKEYEKAELAFDETLQKYPASDKTCSALSEKGLAQREQKKIPEARATLTRVTKECPAGGPEVTKAASALKTLPAR